MVQRFKCKAKWVDFSTCLDNFSYFTYPLIIFLVLPMTYPSAICRVEFQHWKLEYLGEVIQQSIKSWCCSSLQHNGSSNCRIPVFDNCELLGRPHCHFLSDLRWPIAWISPSAKLMILELLPLMPSCIERPCRVPRHLPAVHLFQV